MNKKVAGIVIIIIILAAIITTVAILTKKDKKDSTSNNTNTEQNKTTAREIKSTEDASTIIYYGNGCPHCKKVEEYILSENIDEKIKINMKEIWYNKDNANEISEKADICGMDKEKLGVPLLFDSNTKKCLTGDEDVINFLKEQVANTSAEKSADTAQ